VFVFSADLFSQDTTKSLAFKDNKPRRTTFFYQPDLSYQIWQQFNLTKEANSGNVLAQHELGIRYLLGEGVKADTALGAYWIKKAAEKKLAAAAFNYGILLLNGWGVEWNPFLAFSNFQLAANDGMPEAEYIVGSLYTDNLIVKKDWNKAYLWLKKSSDAGYEPAKKAILNIIKRVDSTLVDTASIDVAGKILSDKQNAEAKSDSLQKLNGNGSSLTSNLGLVFINFDINQDTSIVFTDRDLLEDLALINDDKLNECLYVTKPGSKDSVISFDSLDVSLVLKFAENGSPEALSLLGKFYETGKYFQQNIITAIAYYIRAIKMDSPKAPSLLYEIMKKAKMVGILKKLADDNNAEAMFVWNGLYSLGFDNSITEADAFNLLIRSANLGYMPAIVELGLSYFSGKMVKQNLEKGLELLKKAETLGSLDAKVRIATSTIFDNSKSAEYNSAFTKLIDAEKNGNLLSEVTLGHCYETGKGTKQSFSDAVKYYRYAAQRGSQYAYKELKRLYDSFRPDENIFKLN
jgi:TPR repeat protein